MFRENIRKHYDHLSRSYRRVADFILSDYRTAAFMTAAALADAVDVDTTTVVRFAQRLGYPGFPELIEDIQSQVKVELNQDYSAPAEENTLQAAVQRLVAEDRNHLEKALAHNSLELIETQLDLLRAAPRIIVTGESYAAPLAESFAGMLRDAGLPVVYASPDVYERARALAHLVRKEVVIGITPLEGASGVASLLRFARSEGAATMACTPSLSSQAARAAEHLLYAPGEGTGALPSLTGLYALLIAFAQALATLQPEARAKRQADISHALAELT
ncbi:MAG: MurR/RpiR family transcriptional regulator [Chloroflexi bacterium]|nr:MurR/RpiR family transcriptional regulator [Chloroflexota bacterium]